MVVHQIFTTFAIGLVTGQVKVLAWSRYDAEKQDYLVDTSKLFSSVGWNLVNWNVERTRICLSESTPSYGVDSSFTFSFLRVLPEPNLQESEESRGSHHLFCLWTIMNLFSSQIFLIFAEDNQNSCISLIISIVVSTGLFMVTI